jgi:uncharacterized phage protein (TIGR02220 family)
MHYYSFNIADYRKDTSHLCPTEHYIYRFLIDWYYLDESPIPKETQQVIRRLGLGSQDIQYLLNVLNDFFESTEDGYIHKRIEKEISAYHDRAHTSRVNGKLGGRPKKTQQVNFENPTNNQEPKTNNYDICIECLNYLNHKTKKNFKPVRTNLTFIDARLKEGYSKEDIFRVVDIKTSQWLNDPKMSSYLRPETLFNATKFSSYVAEQPIKRGLVN